MKQWKSWEIFQIQIKNPTLQRIKETVQNILPRNSNYTTFSKKIRFAVSLEYDINTKWPTYYIRMDLVGTHDLHGVWVYTLHHLISNCAKKTNFPPIKSASLIFHEYFRGNTDLWEGIVCCILSINTLGGGTSLWIIALFYTSECTHSLFHTSTCSDGVSPFIFDTSARSNDVSYTFWDPKFYRNDI